MSLNSAENRESIIDLFPGLGDDQNFKVTSNQDEKYNCIAWANGRSDIFWWPTEHKIDGVFWPIEEKDLNVSTLIKVFQTRGYTICENGDFDPKFVKVALYVNEKDEFIDSLLNNPIQFKNQKLDIDWVVKDQEAIYVP
ncbi:MAG: hypothetical protein EOO44_22705, partial [Flavobacterium sp.]